MVDDNVNNSSSNSTTGSTNNDSNVEGYHRGQSAYQSASVKKDFVTIINESGNAVLGDKNISQKTDIEPSEPVKVLQPVHEANGTKAHENSIDNIKNVAERVAYQEKAAEIQINHDKNSNMLMAGMSGGVDIDKSQLGTLSPDAQYRIERTTGVEKDKNPLALA